MPGDAALANLQRRVVGAVVGANHAHVVVQIESRVATSSHQDPEPVIVINPPTHSMSRTPLGGGASSRKPLSREDNDTPDPDDRSRKKVRWNSDSLVEGDKQGDSEESTYDHRVGRSHPFMSTFLVT